MHINNLTKDLESGLKLVMLAEVLVGHPIKHVKNPKLKFHFYENIRAVFDEMKKKIPTLEYDERSKKK